MPNIVLDSVWTLTADSSNWILVENGRQVKFYQNLESACKGYLNLKSRGSEASSVLQLIHYQKQLSERLLQVLNTLTETKSAELKEASGELKQSLQVFSGEAQEK